LLNVPFVIADATTPT
jgi:ATP-dependent Clp protease ATP-binding subunit ClpX